MPELNWNKKSEIEIISNETILNTFLLGEKVPKYLRNISFNDWQLILNDFKFQYGQLFRVHLDNRKPTIFNGQIGNDLRGRGQINLSKGKANLYTTPFKLDKNKENFLIFAKNKKALVPYVVFNLTSKVPDSIIQINQNNLDLNNSDISNTNQDSNGFGSFGIGNTRKIKIEASYRGFLNKLSFEDDNKSIQYISYPPYSRSQIIGLITGNYANLTNRAFISQLDRGNVFSEKLQLSLYPALIENNEPINIFSDENLDINNGQETSSNDSSSEAWVAEIGFDIDDNLNIAVQATPNRDDLLPKGIFTYQPNIKFLPNLELLSSFDSSGDWTSQFQLFWRY